MRRRVGKGREWGSVWEGDEEVCGDVCGEVECKE